MSCQFLPSQPQTIPSSNGCRSQHMLLIGASEAVNMDRTSCGASL